MNNFPDKVAVERLRAQYPAGTRVELTAPMQDPYTNLRVGDRATVTGVDDMGGILCRWDRGSTLHLLPDVDSFMVIGAFSDEIKQQILTIRADKNAPNMFDLPAVQRLAFEKGFYALVNFVETDRAAYAGFILRGE